RLVLDLAKAGDAVAPSASAAAPVAASDQPEAAPAPATADGTAPTDDRANRPRSLLPAHAMTAADLLNGASTVGPANLPADRNDGASSTNMPPLDASAPLMTVAVERSGDGLLLQFPWTGATGLAVFRRSGALWLVFDQPARFDLEALKGH